MPFWQFLPNFSDSTHQEYVIVARIGHGPCYYHWNEIFAGVILITRRIGLNSQTFMIHQDSVPNHAHMYFAFFSLSDFVP